MIPLKFKCLQCSVILLATLLPPASWNVHTVRLVTEGFVSPVRTTNCTAAVTISVSHNKTHNYAQRYFCFKKGSGMQTAAQNSVGYGLAILVRDCKHSCPCTSHHSLLRLHSLQRTVWSPPTRTVVLSNAQCSNTETFSRCLSLTAHLFPWASQTKPCKHANMGMCVY
jgi:hypothetical protein